MSKSTTITVEVIDNDRFSGRSLAYTKTFKTRSKAQAFIDSIHAENTLPSAPETYYTAHIKG